MTARVYHKSVRYRLHDVEINAYKPECPGIQVTFDNHDPVNHEITAHYSCSDDPTLHPTEQRTLDDIEEEISRMEPRIVTESRIKYPNKFYMEVHSILDLPVYDGQYDVLRSKAKDVVSMTISKSQMYDINKRYEKLGLKGLKTNKVDMGTMTWH
ncbi:hypothetical protein [Serratia sp. (in: enterobacteria)]|uniref:hypothetical protein n=1 Tax=Serratia sp. (in: enterobacteria) TaxID=616 RepID=UPI00398A2AA2